ncbi:hypothetical protein JTE90_001281 [Oedothorax gibbosus]|uniref:Uncharacterized protein n=1 Tax=Oedothorax gibbosus TaxID=931172 RepID=A0AAV6V2R3_9ARAC|nr:hypothetical protein JTE90_001281 [Oedothorax gibbosus]
MNILVSLVVILITMQSFEALGVGDLKLNDSNDSQIVFSQILNSVQFPTSNNSKSTSEKDIEFSEFVIDLKQTLTKTISSKLTEVLRSKVKDLLNKYLLENDIRKLNSQNTEQSNSLLNSETSDRNGKESFSNSRELSEKDSSKKVVEARQFVFHPYLPHSKETLPDEKISFHDVLPVKMVKFIKSMVEDAPWEAMFMKMVRMVVDQFVDKIIEQMFAHKDELRSLDASLWSPLKKALASMVRLRRSIVDSKSRKEMDVDGSSFSQSNQLSKNEEPKSREASENESWLDSVLDYLFPEGEAEGYEEDPHLQRQKRETDQTMAVKKTRMEDILHTFLMKYIDLSDGKRSPNRVYQTVQDSSQVPLDPELDRNQQMVQDNKQVPEAPESDNQLVVTTQEEPKMSKTDPNTKRALSERWSKLLQQKDMPAGPLEILRRAKRDVKEEKRLWQEHQASSLKTRTSSLKTRDECSLRKACNAGRLLSRLPSVQDVTLQLKEYGNEPHWDALLWGMAKKRCAKIFCKRQRSPKGSKHTWKAGLEKKYHRKPKTYKRKTHKSF